MRKFERHLDIDEITEACNEAGFFIGRKGYDDHGSDWVKFHFEHESGVEVSVLYNVFNGKFYGDATGPGGGVLEFDAESPLDGLPWFDALLNFIYR